MARPFRIDLRPVFRRFAIDERDRYAKAVGSIVADGATSLANQIRRLKPKLKRWGYVMPYHLVGQKLTFFVRGTKHQPARPMQPVHPRVDALAEQVQDVIVRTFAAWDREQRV